MGPSYATPNALDRGRPVLKDMDVIDMHEAFAAQVLCNVKVFGSKKFAEEKLGQSEAIGEIDDAKLNVHGGSIAIGHPFAATGARMVTTVLHELKRRRGRFGLATACAAGGLGAAVVVGGGRMSAADGISATEARRELREVGEVTREEAAMVHATGLIDLAVRGDGIAVLTVNDPREPVNTLTRELAEELAAALERIERETAIKGAVIASAKKDFVVGANIDMLKAVKLASDAEAMGRSMGELLGKIADLKKPFVAAVHGAALGGGFEIALACDAIVLSDDPSTGVGLPEVQLGLLPAANGTLRIVDRAGLKVALDLALTGRRVRAVKAKKLGLVDEVCPRCPPPRGRVRPRSRARRARRRKAKQGGEAEEERVPARAAPAQKRARHRGARGQPARPRDPLQEGARGNRKKTHGHYPAAERIIDVLER